MKFVTAQASLLLLVAFPNFADAQYQPAATRSGGMTIDQIISSRLADHQDRIEALELRVSRMERLCHTADGSQKATHTVARGENLYSIGRQYGVSAQELAAANNIQVSQIIYVGDRLFIPGQGAGSQWNGATTQPVSHTGHTQQNPYHGTDSSWGTYTVQRGDTLTGIARRYGTTSQRLQQANQLPNANSLRVGQQIRVPGRSGGGSTQAQQPQTGNQDTGYHYYEVIQGDTLRSVSDTFFTNEAEIRRLNNLPAGARLTPGQSIIVPTDKYFANLRSQGVMS